MPKRTYSMMAGPSSRPGPYSRPWKMPRYTAPYAARARLRRRNIRTAGFLGIETKYYDTGLNQSALTAPHTCEGGEHDPATVLTLSAPAQGDGEQNREGRKILVKSVQINGTIHVEKQADQTAGDNGVTVFVALVQDMQTNGAQLNSEDVFTNPIGVNVVGADPLRNMQYTSRFRVLATRRINIYPPPMTYDGTNIEQAGVQRPFHIFKKLSMPVGFTTTASAGYSGVVDNSLHVIAYASNTTMSPSISYNARIRFVG